jgi:hypothetical protein
VYCQYRAGRHRRSLCGIDDHVAKAQRAIHDWVALNRNPFIKLTGATQRVNGDLEAKPRALAGWKG